MKMPVKLNETDENGIVYTEEAIKQSCENANGKPIVTYSEKGERIIGVASDVRYEEGHILINGYLYAGGTIETVLFDNSKQVISMEIAGFGLCK
ncbi:hypothetical protein KQI61_05900 [Anaerocolumna aminovalerica]|uniref:hypothetical protein n=1 Tax=Anaerocolumna aminovalerica TaxID=1527 RepID=UPI001C0EC69C|nr:hypothetical protein [Anaerocolumna aminovalerica]MBU5331723.1 hypothetical protein [Anaerocolumna aminovalerica]